VADVSASARAAADEAAGLERPLARGRPLVGYALIVVATALGGINATIAKIVIVAGGVGANRLAELRAAGAALLLLAGIALLGRGRTLPGRSELPFLVLFGIVGLAAAQFTYFVSIERLQIGVALLIVNLAVVLVALWGRFVGGERVNARLWLAIGLALGGLALVVEIWRGVELDALGVVAALVAAFAYAAYILLADRSAHAGRPASFLVAWGFVFATAFWTLAQPWWTFPFDLLDDRVSLLGRLEGHEAPLFVLLAYVIPFGTLGVFLLYAAALRYIPPTHVVVAAVLEPVFGAVVAFAWLGETLAPPQIAGGLLVVAAVVLGQAARERPAAAAHAHA
jgi:drug/metabolite transporter (DMT)-like permease